MRRMKHRKFVFRLNTNCPTRHNEPRTDDNKMNNWTSFFFLSSRDREIARDVFENIIKSCRKSKMNDSKMIFRNLSTLVACHFQVYNLWKIDFYKTTNADENSELNSSVLLVCDHFDEVIKQHSNAQRGERATISQFIWRWCGAKRGEKLSHPTSVSPISQHTSCVRYIYSLHYKLFAKSVDMVAGEKQHPFNLISIQMEAKEMNAMWLALQRNARSFAYLLYRDLSADHVPCFSCYYQFQFFFLIHPIAAWMRCSNWWLWEFRWMKLNLNLNS